MATLNIEGLPKISVKCMMLAWAKRWDNVAWSSSLVSSENEIWLYKSTLSKIIAGFFQCPGQFSMGEVVNRGWGQLERGEKEEDKWTWTVLLQWFQWTVSSPQPHASPLQLRAIQFQRSLNNIIPLPHLSSELGKRPNLSFTRDKTKMIQCGWYL